MTPEIDPDTGLRAAPATRPFPVGPSSFEELRSQLAARSDGPAALIDGERTWTGTELVAEVDRAADALARRFQQGGHVGWSLPNCAELVIGFFATQQAGMVWMGLGRHLSAPERDVLAARAGLAVVIDDPSSWSDAVKVEQPRPKSGIAALSPTSGTTGRPKLVAHREQSLLWPAAASIETEPAQPGEVTATPLALTSLNLMILGPLSALARGGTALILRTTVAAEIAAAIAATVKRHRVTRLIVVPTMLHDLVALEPRPDLSSLRTVLVGGAGSAAGLRSRFRDRFGLDPTLSYGLSESPTGVARTSEGQSSAQALPGVDIAIAEGGEITLQPTTSGPWAHTWTGAAGYWRDRAATEALWQAGRLRTGDLGVLDGDGLRVTGRAGDAINRGGVTIHPRAIEEALLAIPGVSAAAVVGLVDDRLGQRIGAVVTATANADTVAHAARERLGGGRSPDVLRVVDAIPTNAGGKVDQEAVRALLR